MNAFISALYRFYSGGFFVCFVFASRGHAIRDRKYGILPYLKIVANDSEKEKKA